MTRMLFETAGGAAAFPRSRRSPAHATLRRMDLTEHARRNQALWNANAEGDHELADRQWATDEITWGIWSVPETPIGSLPEVEGRDVVELGCGTGYVSAWLARRGARPTGVDLSENQLETARRKQAE